MRHYNYPHNTLCQLNNYKQLGYWGRECPFFLYLPHSKINAMHKDQVEKATPTNEIQQPSNQQEFEILCYPCK